MLFSLASFPSRGSNYFLSLSTDSRAVQVFARKDCPGWDSTARLYPKSPVLLDYYPHQRHLITLFLQVFLQIFGAKTRTWPLKEHLRAFASSKFTTFASEWPNVSKSGQEVRPLVARAHLRNSNLNCSRGFAQKGEPAGMNQRHHLDWTPKQKTAKLQVD